MRQILLWLTFLVTTTGSTWSQAPVASAFQLKAQTAVSSGRLFNSVTLTANADWIAGSQHETGTAQLLANADGSTNVQLNIGQASRTEIQTKADSSRTCSWTDNAGTTHDIFGPNCLIAAPWFASNLFTQPASQLPAMVATTDMGEVSKNGMTLHQISFSLGLQGANNAATNPLVSQSTVNVFYDQQTFLPVSLEYNVHPDNNDLQNIPIRVAFSNYQSVSGVMVPFHIEKYVNRTLQLTLDVTSASLQ